MDPRKFDEMIKKLSQSLSRRSIVRGSVGASLLTAAGLSEDALAAKNKKNRGGKKDDKDKGKKDDKDKGKDKKGGGKDNKGGAKQNNKKRGGNDNDRKDNDKKGGGGAGAEACIPTGKRCPSKKPRGKKKKKLGCERCCQDEVVTVTNNKGRQVTKCACKPLDAVCTPDKSHQCCSGVCGDGRCQFAPCTSIGGSCTGDFDCCSFFCSGGTCQSLS